MRNLVHFCYRHEVGFAHDLLGRYVRFTFNFGIVAGVAGEGDVVSRGTPTFLHPCKNATRRLFALAILASQKALTPPETTSPSTQLLGTIVAKLMESLGECWESSDRVVSGICKSGWQAGEWWFICGSSFWVSLRWIGCRL